MLEPKRHVSEDKPEASNCIGLIPFMWEKPSPCGFG